VEVDRGALVGEYVGHTRTQDPGGVSPGSGGGVLFIDEAYALVPAGQSNDFGQEAISTLVKLMEDHRDQVVSSLLATRTRWSVHRREPGPVLRFSTAR